MPVSGAGSFSPGGNQIVYSPQARDFRTEKRYSGGEANKLYIFDIETHAAKRISEGPRASRDPMWIGKEIYYNSDSDGHFNLYAYDTGNGTIRQITQNTTWDVRWPSTDREQRIVYELDGELQVLDVKTGKSTHIAVRVPDDGVNRQPQLCLGGQPDRTGRSSVRKASACCLRRAAIYSRLPWRRGRRAISRIPPARTTNGRPGRPMAPRSLSCRTPAGEEEVYRRRAGRLFASRKDHQRRPRVPLRSEMVAG